MSLTDSRRFYKECRDAGTEGIHSWDCYGWTRNASQRAKDVTTKGFQIYVKTERRNGRAGARYWLEGFQPSDAIPVKPNFDAEGSHTASSDARVTEQTPRVAPPGADVEGGGGIEGEPAQATVTPLSAEPVALFDTYDYTPRARYGREEEAA